MIQTISPNRPGRCQRDVAVDGHQRADVVAGQDLQPADNIGDRPEEGMQGEQFFAAFELFPVVALKLSPSQTPGGQRLLPPAPRSGFPAGWWRGWHPVPGRLRRLW